MKQINKKETATYLLLGSPNVGKSTFFNRITWKTEKVGNADRVTTFASTSHLRSTKHIHITDLPGVINLNPHGDDEKETFKHIFASDYSGVINIVGASSLQRDLYLTYELAEAGILSMIVVNMIDEIGTCLLNKLVLTKEFKVLVECISSKKNMNVKSAVLPMVNSSLTFNYKQITYDLKIENFLNDFIKLLPPHKIAPRFIAIQALQNNSAVLEYLDSIKLSDQFEKCVAKHEISQDDVHAIALVKDNLVENLVKTIFSTEKIVSLQTLPQNKFRAVADQLLLNKWFAIPIFVLIMAAIYFLTFYEYLGGWIQVQFADNALGELQRVITDSIANLNPDSSLQMWWASFVGDGLIGGPFTILSFLPWVLILVGLITILEQIGLLTRMSIVFDNAFSKTGISGRAVINLITGLGCNVPAIMMSRNANSVKERVTTAMLSPFVSCSARVIVFGFLSQILVSTEFSWLLNLGLTATSIAVALFFGYFFSNLLFRKNISIFSIEVVRLRSPHLIFVIKKMVLEAFDFVKRTILIVLLANFVVWLLLYTAPTSQFYIDPTLEDGINGSFLRYIAIPFQYLLYPLGLGTDWRFSVSLLAAFPAKEIAASNIEILFGGIEGFQAAISLAPVAISFSYLMFFSFYVPCLVTIVILFKEIGRKYAWTNIGYGLFFSYCLAMGVYAIAVPFELAATVGVSTLTLVLGSLLIVSLLIYGIIYAYKQYHWKQATVWNLKQFKTYKLSLIINTSIFGTLLLTTSLLATLYH